MTKAQEYLEKQYSLFIRKHIKEIDISARNLTGKLDLKDFESLETLYCSYNSLTKLESLEKTKLKNLYCNDNRITELDLDFLLSLDDLDCSNNYLNYPDLNLVNRKLVKQLQKENELLKEQISQLLLNNPSGEVKIKYDTARREVKIIQPEPDEKQIELDLITDYLSEEECVSPTTQTQLTRLKALKEFNYQSKEKEIKQARRQCQILVLPKKNY
ncbi:leucine-rich repeat domain-containing protein [endosymbiont GvMRE of Glomus versiforme]|uniref:leucine-rich repeat domain-containing protein n=1 Tax=endosymbiont GvMRE of Glomus versiforme TaxID=2039283 RepID=UPI000EE16673|nr:leucine-rich repeat domain-containing protein [endosymbiont GvMRE of Glomus versiforme]RHZ36756.1 hypothetical protein GvMRE_I2g72 [endosymbiont GvMRE of Glomus versiforme]